MKLALNVELTIDPRRRTNLVAAAVGRIELSPARSDDARRSAQKSSHEQFSLQLTPILMNAFRVCCSA